MPRDDLFLEYRGSILESPSLPDSHMGAACYRGQADTMSEALTDAAAAEIIQQIKGSFDKKDGNRKHAQWLLGHRGQLSKPRPA